jgi:hypothetical protein
VQGLKERAAGGSLAQLEHFLPGGLFAQHRVQRTDVAAHRVGFAPVEVPMPLGNEVPLHARHVDGPVLPLLNVGMHRLVRKEQGERLAALATHIGHGAVGEDVGDVALDPALFAAFP